MIGEILLHQKYLENDMKRVVCKKETYEELYQSEHYQYVPLLEYEDLIGFHGIEVIVHESECDIALEEALIVLAKFGYIRLTYVEESGIQHSEEALEDEVWDGVLHEAAIT